MPLARFAEFESYFARLGTLSDKNKPDWPEEGLVPYFDGCEDPRNLSPCLPAPGNNLQPRPLEPFDEKDDEQCCRANRQTSESNGHHWHYSSRWLRAANVQRLGLRSLAQAPTNQQEAHEGPPAWRLLASTRLPSAPPPHPVRAREQRARGGQARQRLHQ